MIMFLHLTFSVFKHRILARSLNALTLSKDASFIFCKYTQYIIQPNIQLHNARLNWLIDNYYCNVVRCLRWYVFLVRSWWHSIPLFILQKCHHVLQNCPNYEPRVWLLVLQAGEFCKKISLSFFKNHIPVNNEH